MKRHNFDKLAVYTEGGTTWLMVYVVGVVNAYWLFIVYRLLTTAMNPEISADLLNTVQSGTAGFALLYFLFGILELAAVVAAAILLPALTATSYRVYYIQFFTTLGAYPLTMLMTAILGAKPPAGFALPNTLFYLAWTVFSIVNTVYFVKRRDIFFTDIVRLVTGREKDESKH